MAFDKIFKIASFNCFNLLRPSVVYYNKPAYSENEFGRKLEWCAGLLERTQADLVSFQEVFHEEALQALVDRVPHLEGAEVVALGASRDENERPDDNDPGQLRAIMPKVGLAMTLEVLDKQEIRDFPTGAELRFPSIDPATGVETLVELPLRTFQRPILKARVKLSNDVPATVFVAHLKSKRPSTLEDHGESGEVPLHRALGAVRSLVIRAAEAAALRALVLDVVDDPDDTDAPRGEPVIVIGDLNDSDAAVSTKVVSGERPWIFPPFQETKRIWDTLLYNVHDLQAEQSLSSHAYSHIHDGHYEMLDHIMLSQEFNRLFRGHVGAFRNARIYNDHLVDGAQSDERSGRTRRAGGGNQDEDGGGTGRMIGTSARPRRPIAALAMVNFTGIPPVSC